MPYAFCGVPGVDIFKSNINKRIIYNSMADAECLWRHDAVVSGNRQCNRYLCSIPTIPIMRGKQFSRYTLPGDFRER